MTPPDAPPAAAALPVTLRPRWGVRTWRLALVTALFTAMGLALYLKTRAPGDLVGLLFFGGLLLVMAGGRLAGLPRLSLAPGRLEFQSLPGRRLVLDLDAHARPVLVNRSNRGIYHPWLEIVPLAEGGAPCMLSIRAFADSPAAAAEVLARVNAAAAASPAETVEQTNRRLAVWARGALVLLVGMLLIVPALALWLLIFNP